MTTRFVSSGKICIIRGDLVRQRRRTRGEGGSANSPPKKKCLMIDVIAGSVRELVDQHGDSLSAIPTQYPGDRWLSLTNDWHSREIQTSNGIFISD